MTTVESPEHFERRRAHRPSEPVDVKRGVKRWTFNQQLTDEEVAQHFAGLKIVSQPGALYGPPKAPKADVPAPVPPGAGLLDPLTKLFKRGCDGCGGWWVQTEPVKERVGGTCSCHPSASP